MDIQSKTWICQMIWRMDGAIRYVADEIFHTEHMSKPNQKAY